MARAKTAAERKADERSRKRAAGYVLRQIWVRPENWQKVKNYLRSFDRSHGHE